MCNWLDLETLGCHPVIPKNLSRYYTHMLYYMVMKFYKYGLLIFSYCSKS
jgi:hypothetical protein